MTLAIEGATVGTLVGFLVGAAVGTLVGFLVGTWVGETEGPVGDSVRGKVGEEDGELGKPGHSSSAITMTWNNESVSML